MNERLITAIRNTYGEEIDHLTDEMLLEILWLTPPSMIRIDNSLLRYLLCWQIFENFADAAEVLFTNDYKELSDSAVTEERSCELLKQSNYEWFTTNDHEVVVMVID